MCCFRRPRKTDVCGGGECYMWEGGHRQTDRRDVWTCRWTKFNTSYVRPVDMNVHIDSQHQCHCCGWVTRLRQSVNTHTHTLPTSSMVYSSLHDNIYSVPRLNVTSTFQLWLPHVSWLTPCRFISHLFGFISLFSFWVQTKLLNQLSSYRVE